MAYGKMRGGKSCPKGGKKSRGKGGKKMKY